MSGDTMVSGGGEPPKLESQRSIPTPFLTKTYQIVEDPSLNDLISWNEDGTAFIVWHPAEFSRDLLPKYFKHNNFSSFVRQLNTYGFRKIAPDRWEFANDCFKRGEKSMLRDIQRRKISTASPSAATMTAANVQSVAVAVAVQISPADSGDEQVLSSNSSPARTAPTATPTPAAVPEILEENARLKRENAQLTLELSRLKAMCSSIYNLMSSYTLIPGEAVLPEKGAFESMPDTQDAAAKAAEAEEEEMCPRIFGVPIGVKRLKMCEDVKGDDRTTRGSEFVKLEQLDLGSSNSHDT